MTQMTFGVHFIIRNDREDGKGFVPIYSKININGQILKISVNQKILVADWDSEIEQPKQSCKNYKIIFNAILAFKSRIYQAYSKILASNIELTAANLKFEFLGKKEVVQINTLIESVIEHNNNFERLIGVKYSQGSYKNYKTTLKYLIEFVPAFCKKKDISLKEVNYSFCEAFYDFLTTKKECKANGANKQIQRLKKIINESVRKGLILQNPMANFRLKFTPVNKVALNMDEIKRIEKLNLNREVLINVRNVFIFQCYTGLAYADVKRLSDADLDRDGNGDYWIKMNRLKTKVSFSVPLLQPALIILRKYGFNNDKSNLNLPVISNQKMNDNLKVIQELASIEKNLTTHLARHSFATTITLSNGIPIETVSKMLGHTKLSTTQLYAKVHESKISNDMQGLMDKMKK